MWPHHVSDGIAKLNALIKVLFILIKVECSLIWIVWWKLNKSQDKCFHIKRVEYNCH